MLVQFDHLFHLVYAFFVSKKTKNTRVFFLGSRISIFYSFSDLSRAPAPLCDHGLLRLRLYVRTTTATTYANIPGTTEYYNTNNAYNLICILIV